jgi:hypothetical protein
MRENNYIYIPILKELSESVKGRKKEGRSDW